MKRVIRMAVTGENDRIAINFKEKTLERERQWRRALYNKAFCVY